jgi:hypothetical protein
MAWRHVRAQAPAGEPDLIVHEWGTFTSVAGNDGNAVEWSPLGRPPVLSELPDFADLPGFVETFLMGFKVGLSRK